MRIFFWLPGRCLARLIKPVTDILDNLEELEREYNEFLEAHGLA